MGISKDYWSIMAGLYAPGKDPDDEEVLTPAMLDLYKQLKVQDAKLMADFVSADTKRQVQRLKSMVDMAESSNKALTDLIGFRTNASIATAKNATALWNNLDDNITKTVIQLEAVDPAYEAQIRQTAKTATAQGGVPAERAQLIGALTTTFQTVDGVDPGSRDSMGTVNKVLLDTIGVGLDDPNVISILRDTLGEDRYSKQALSNAARYKAEYDESRNLLAFQSQGKDLIDGFNERIAAVGAGSPGAKAAAKKLADDLASLSEQLGVGGQFASMALQSDSAIQAFNEARDEALDATRKQRAVYEEIEDRILDRGTDYRKVVLESEAFQQWAKENGYKNLGGYRTIEVNGDARTVYNEGADDTDAIALYQWQQQHPDKVRPGVPRRMAVDRVRAYEQDLTPEELSRFGQVEGQFIKRGDNYVKANDPLFKLINEDHYQIELDGDRDNTYYVGKLSKEEELKHKAYVDGYIKLRDTDPGKAQALLDELKAAHLERPVFKVDKDGNVSQVLDSATISKVQESFSESDKTVKGQAVLDSMPTVESAKEPPKKTVTVEVGTLHAGDIKEGRVVRRGYDSNGDVVEIDPETFELVSEAESARDLPRLRDLTPEEQLAKGVASLRQEEFDREKPLDRTTSEDRKERREDRKEARQEKKDEGLEKVDVEGLEAAKASGIAGPKSAQTERYMLSDPELDRVLSLPPQALEGPKYPKADTKVRSVTDVSGGASTNRVFVESGTGSLLSGVAQRIKPQAKAPKLKSPFDEDAEKAFDDLDLTPLRIP